MISVVDDLLLRSSMNSMMNTTMNLGDSGPCLRVQPVSPTGWSISPGGSPPKGVNKGYKDFFREFLSKISGSKTQVFVFSGGPGGFMELREADRNHFHLLSGSPG